VRKPQPGIPGIPDLDTGEMHIFLTKVEAWCAQFGLALTIPHGCEYQQLRDKQEA
jgi:hypothetical protein